MATFIQGVTDTNLDPVLFTPDYSFLRYALDKKTDRYEQGLKSVSTAYGALKKELSDPTNVERRDQYLKTAESELQKIASADLSLQQNVNSANAIFDNISTDPAIAYDAYHTQRIKRELATMERWGQSDDMETRKKFNPELYKWLKRDIESLKSGNGDVNNYNVQGRKAWAFVDAQDIINQAAKDQGFKVETDDLGKPYIVTTSGGATFAPNYDAFAKSVLDANPVYQQQRQILAQSKVESKIEQARMDPLNAGLSKEQLLEKFTDKEYDLSNGMQKDYLSDLNNKLSVQTSEYKAYVDKNAAAIQANPQGDESKRAQLMAANLTQFKSQVDQVVGNYNSQYGSDPAAYELKKKEFKKKFLSNPEGYYANQIELEDATRFSNIRSSFGTRSIKADQGYLGVLNAADKARNTLNNIADDQFDNNMDVEELKIKQLNAAKKLAGKTTTGESRKNADGSDKTADISFSGISSVQVNVETRLDQLKDRLALSEAGAVQNLTGTFGGLYLLEKMGAKPEDVSLVRQFFSRKLTGNDAKASKEEQAALQNAYQTMFSWAKLDENQNASMLTDMRKAVSNKTPYQNLDIPGLLRMAAKNYQPKDNYESNAIRAMFDFDKNQAEIKRISAAVDKGTEVVINTIKDDKDFAEILVTEKGADGKQKTRLISAEDIVARMPSKAFESVNWATDPSVSLTPEDKLNIARGYLAGNIKVTHKGKYRYGTETIGDIFKDDPGSYVEYQGKTIYFNSDFKTFPLPTKDLQNRMKRFNEKVPIPEFNTAVAGAAVEGSASYVIKNEPAEQIRNLLTSPTQENSNIFEMGGGSYNDYKQVDPEQQKAIRAAMATKGNVEQIKIFTTSPINEGKQVVEVTFASKKSEKDDSPTAGKVLYFPINVTGRSPQLFKIFGDVGDMEEFTEYSKNNKPYALDYHEASGVKAMIYADQPGSKTGTVRLYSKYDPATKKYTDNWVEQAPIPFDLNKVTFNEIKEEIYNNYLDPYVQRRMVYNKQAAASSTPGAGTDILGQLKKVVTW